MTDEQVPDLLDTAVQAAASLVPYVGGALQVFADHERQRFLARTAEFEDHLLSTVERERIREAFDDERRAQLLMRAIVAIGASAWEEKRRALGAAAAAAVADDATLDDSELIVAAILELDRVHVATLARFTSWSDDTNSAFTVASAGGGHPSVVATLSRHGLIESRGIDSGESRGDPGGTLYEVTDFGRDVLNLLS